MKRAGLIYLLFFFLFLLIIQRLFVIQVLNQNKILDGQKYLNIDKHPSLRGEIFDRFKKPLVLNRKVYDVYANIDQLKNQQELQKLLKSQLKIKESTMAAFLTLNEWRRIKNNIVEQQKKILQKYYPTYLNFEESWDRYYPEGSTSAYILGFLGKDEVGQAKGYLGIEGYFNQELSGRPYLGENETDLAGVPFFGSLLNEQRDFAGMDIYLTIDQNIQKMIETELYKGLYKYQAKKACAIVEEPESGKIVALACVPGYEPEKYAKYQDQNFLNSAIGTVYEPGSTFKPLIVAMALEENKITPQTILEEKGPEIIGQYSINTWDNKYRGKISIGDTLAKSSNVGMVKIIERLKRTQVDKYLTALGLRENTGIELEGEVGSLIKEEGDWYDIDYATISFGQGFAITPTQLLRAFSVLANNGKLLPLSVVDYLYDQKNNIKIKPQRASPKTVFSEKTAQQMRKLLFYAINKSEAYWPNKLSGYSFCGKTGTAQIAVSGKYDPSKTNASFIGFTPCDNPKYLMLVLYSEPQSSPWGSETAAPTFFELSKQLILYYNISPDI